MYPSSKEIGHDRRKLGKERKIYCCQPTAIFYQNILDKRPQMPVTSCVRQTGVTSLRLNADQGSV